MSYPSLRSEWKEPFLSSSEDNLWDFIEKVYNDYKIVVNGVIIFIGLFLCFLGLKSVVFNMFLCGFLAGGVPTFVIATELLSNTEKEEQAFWISIGVSCVMGLIIGILLIFLYKIGYFVIGLGLGAIIAIYTDIVLECILRFHSDVVLYVAVGTISLEFGIFAMIWDKILVILGTSVIGSYMITFGLSQFIGNWINPFSPLFPQQLVNPPWEWYLYLSILAGFTIFGVIVQAATNRGPKEPKESPDTTLPLIINQDTSMKEIKEEKPVAKERQYKTLRELQADRKSVV